MTETVTLELPEELAQQARAVASRTQRRFEDVLVDWLRHAGTEPPVESLPDDELLALCDAEMDETSQDELGELLDRNREGQMDEAGRGRLEELMRVYRRGTSILRQAGLEKSRKGGGK